jgi:hypothetical protein
VGSCTESVSGLDQLEQTSQEKLSSVESDCQQDGKFKRMEGLFFLFYVLGILSLINS